jgi:hypothetical protein
VLGVRLSRQIEFACNERKPDVGQIIDALDGVGGQRHVPATLTRETDPVPIVQEAGWAPQQA